MKLKYRKLLIGAAIASVLGATGMVYAHEGGNWQQGTQMQQGCGSGGPAMGMGMGMNMMHGMMGSSGMMGPGGMMGGMQRGMGLELSNEQRSEIGKIREDILPLMGELHGKMQVKHEQMRDFLLSGAEDQSAIATLADQKGELMAEMIKLRSQLRARIWTLLTEEQREQMIHRGTGKMGMGKMGG